MAKQIAQVYKNQLVEQGSNILPYNNIWKISIHALPGITFSLGTGTIIMNPTGFFSMEYIEPQLLELKIISNNYDASIYPLIVDIVYEDMNN